MVIVALQLFSIHGLGHFAPATPLTFMAMMGSFTIGALLLVVWWLFFSRARWSDRFLALGMMIAVHAVAFYLADPSATMFVLMPGIPWLCAAFVASLFFRSRAVTAAAILVASLG